MKDYNLPTTLPPRRAPEKILDISWETIFKIFIAVICLYLLYLVRNILVWFIFAVIISILLNPLFDFFQRRKFPRLISVLIVYFLVFGLISFLIYLTIPLFISEIHQLVQIFPQYFEKIAPPLKGLGLQAFKDLENFIDFLSKNLENIATNVFKTLSALFGGILSTFFVLSIAIFLSLEEKPIEKTLSLLFPKKYEAYILALWQRCQTRISNWFLSRILGCLFVGVLSFLSLLIFKAKYPFSLGLLAGILDFIPVIGPVITGALIFMIVSLDNLLRAVFVLIVFILIHQIEGNIIFPILTKKFVGLSPVLVLLALAVGGILWGIWGAILAIPLFGILYEFLRDFLRKRKEEGTVVL